MSQKTQDCKAPRNVELRLNNTLRATKPAGKVRLYFTIVVLDPLENLSFTFAVYVY